jgi:hypothetical protein
MVSRSNQVQLTDEVARFEESVRIAAIEIVQLIFRQELLNRLGELKRDLVATDTSRTSPRALRKDRLAPRSSPSSCGQVRRAPKMCPSMGSGWGIAEPDIK